LWSFKFIIEGDWGKAMCLCMSVCLSVCHNNDSGFECGIMIVIG